MSDLLDNELVRKYFQHDECLRLSGTGTCDHNACAALRVLRAMQEPIRKGELVLERFPSNPNEWELMKAPRDFDADLHAGFLRLPDRFQGKSIDVRCDKCGRGPIPDPAKPSDVEDKIQRLCQQYDPKITNWQCFESELRALVDLVRKEEKS
jgi:hypothetical protein